MRPLCVILICYSDDLLRVTTYILGIVLQRPSHFLADLEQCKIEGSLDFLAV